MLIKILIFITIFNLYNCLEANYIEVKTTSGLIKGNVLTVLNHTINQFLGIPYAEPPLGSLRFAKPKPITKPLEGTIDATKPKNSCLQTKLSGHDPNILPPEFRNLTENEDCLVLNIWSPKVQINETKLKPVMFWLFGGTFLIGSIFQLPSYDGRVLATNDVIVVTANYRLGAFGFLYGGQESAPGNVGLYDQTLALKWVKENIHAFGGDSNKITIFGVSAGSWGVTSLILSPISRNLFQRAIAQSSAVISSKTWGTFSKEEALTVAKELSKSFNCSDNNQWLDCLRKVDALEISSYSKPKYSYLFETEFLPFSAQNAFKNGNFSKGIQLMSGVTENEGTVLSYYSFPNLSQNINKTVVKDMMKAILIPGIDGEKVSNFYLSDVEPNNKTGLILAFGAFFGDWVITCPTYFFAHQFAEYSPKDSVYFYELTQKHNDSYPDWMGVPHGTDVEFVFGTPFLKVNERTESDRDFSKLVMSLWTNFAKTGNPVSVNSSIQWPTLRKTPESPVISRVMELNSKFGHILNEPFHKNCEGFWKQYFL